MANEWNGPCMSAVMKRWIGAALAFMATLSSLAQPPAARQDPAPSNSIPVLDDVLKILSVVPVTLRSVFAGEHTWDEWHDAWSEDISHRVDYIDHFFGDEILKDDNRDTRLLLRTGLRFDRADIVAIKSQISVRLALPQLQRRLQIILDNGVAADEAKELRVYEKTAKESAPDAGVRYLVKDEAHLRLHLDGGIHFSSTPQLFGRVRTRYTLPLDLWQLRLQERVEWLSRDGFEQTSEIIWDRKLANKADFRIRSAVDWEDRNRGVTPEQSFTYYRILNARASCKAGVRAFWPETPYGGNDVYMLETGYRRLLYGDWLFLEVNPGLEFTHSRDYDVNPFVVVLFEVTFQRDRPLGRERGPRLDQR